MTALAGVIGGAALFIFGAAVVARGVGRINVAIILVGWFVCVAGCVLTGVSACQLFDVQVLSGLVGS